MKKQQIPTNKHGVPPSLFYMLAKDDYDKVIVEAGSHVFSATELVRPTQLWALEKRYSHLTDSDVSDKFWIMLGKIAHHIAFMHSPASAIAENRIVVKFSDNVYITAKPDSIIPIEISDWDDSWVAEVAQEWLEDQGRFNLSIPKLDRVYDSTLSGWYDIEDYKVTSVWSYIDALNSGKSEWEKQLNVYKWAVESFAKSGGFDSIQGFKGVRSIKVRAILRDWTKSQSVRSSEYPGSPFGTINIPIWEEHDVVSYIKEKTDERIASLSVQDSELPPCSASEMWQKPSKVALMKHGRKSAVRLFDSEVESRKYARENGIVPGHSGYYLDKRIGSRVRCESFCPVSAFCNQNRSLSSEVGCDE